MPWRPVLRLAPLRQLLRPYATGEGTPILAGVGLGIGAVVLEVARPWPLKWMLDAVTGATGAPTTPASLALSGGLFVAIGVGAAAAAFGQALLLHGAAGRVTHRLRDALRAQVLRQPLGFHDRHDVGELLTRIVSDTARLRRGLSGALSRVARGAALCVATFAALAVADWRLALVLTAGAGVSFGLMRARGRRITRAARRLRRREGRLAALVHDELHAVRELQGAAYADTAGASAFARRSERTRRKDARVEQLAQGLALRVDVVQGVSVAVALALGAWQVVTGGSTPGDLLLFLSYALSLRTPLVDFAHQTARLGRLTACADRVLRMQQRMQQRMTRLRAPDTTPAVPGSPPAEPPRVAPLLRPPHGALRFEGVTLRAPKRQRSGRAHRLDGVSFEVPAGQRVAVVGGNGAGKSTLLALVLRFADPTQGRVLLDGHDLRDYDLESVRRQVSLVLQGGVLPGLTVRENVTLGHPDASPDAVRAALAAAGAADLVDRLPRGLDTLVRRGGALLSGGERQRLVVARALLRDGGLWVLDEPTTGLDRAASDQVVERLLEATDGRTTLWVTHDAALVARLDWCLALDAGRVTYCGPARGWSDVGPRTTSLTLTA